MQIACLISAQALGKLTSNRIQQALGKLPSNRIQMSSQFTAKICTCPSDGL